MRLAAKEISLAFIEDLGLKGFSSFAQRACKSDDVFIVRPENSILRPQFVDVFLVSKVALFFTLTFKE